MKCQKYIKFLVNYIYAIDMVIDWAFLFIAGLIAGIFSGLLGIGGGVILVPTLFFALPYLANFEKLMQTVIATSLSAMVFTTLSSFLFHLKNKEIHRKIIIYSFISIILGCILGSLTSHLISHKVLTICFSIFLIIISCKFFFDFKLNLQRQNIKILIPIGSIIGFLSSFLGIGGGVIALPLFSSFNISFKKAIGTAAFTTFLTSLIGSISYLIIGCVNNIKQIDSVSYIYLPAFITMGIAMLITTPIGVRLTKKISIKALKKIFAVILFITALNMLRHLFF